MTDQGGSVGLRNLGLKQKAYLMLKYRQGSVYMHTECVLTIRSISYAPRITKSISQTQLN